MLILNIKCYTCPQKKTLGCFFREGQNCLLCICGIFSTENVTVFFEFSSILGARLHTEATRSVRAQIQVHSQVPSDSST